MSVNFIDQITNILKAAFLLSIIVVSIVIAQTSILINQPLIATAITFDLVITLPFAYWFFIRKTKISKLTAAGIFTFGIIIAALILPADNRRFLTYLEYAVLPLIELGTLGYAGFIIYKSRKTYKSLIKKRKDFLIALRETLAAEFPNVILANAVSFEIAGFYYAFVGWKIKRGERFFTYHKTNGTAALLIVIGFLVAIETSVLHFLIITWNIYIAWILTALSIYFLFQIFAHGKAIFLRPMEISEDKLFIRCGFLGDAEIDLSNIASIDLIMPPSKLEDHEVKLTPLGDFTASNLKISLRNDAIFNGIYGRKKNFKTIFLTVDEKEKFKAEIEKQIK